jgi:hypothetical protein
MKSKVIFFTVILLVFVVACGGSDVPEVTRVFSTVVGLDTAVTETAPTATPTTQATLPPPPTAAPQPATATPLSQPTSEPTPDGAVTLLTKEDFGTDRNPLTGELVDGPSVLERRPLAVKISNAPSSYVRPQSGINQADWIFEHLAEGAVTRFTALIYSKSPAEVGPIRSARLIDLELPAMYDAALLYSGTSSGVGNRIAQSDIADQIVRVSETGSGYFRTGDETKAFEHTLYAKPERVWQGLETRGIN